MLASANVRRLGRLFGIPLLLLTLAVTEGAAQEPGAGGWEEGFFELFVQRLPGRLPLVTLVDSAGRTLVPLRPVLEHVEIPVEAAGDSLVLAWPPGPWQTVLLPRERVLRRGEVADTFAADDWVHRGGESFVAADVLANVLDAEVEVVFSDLTVVVAENLSLPAIGRRAMEARRARDRLRGAPAGPAGFTDLPYHARTGGAAGTWGLSLRDAGGVASGSFRGAVGMGLLGGALETGATGVFEEQRESALEDGFLRYTRAFPQRRWVREIGAGHLFAEGPIGRRIVGLSLTNEPYSAPRYFGEALIEPTVPAGWEYELYQGDRLVGVSSSDAPEQLQAPLNYGNNPVRVRLIGPAGQQIEEELVFVVPPGRVPPGELRYSLGGGRCRDAGCESYGYGEVRHGFGRALSGGVGIDRLDPGAAAARYRPYLQLGYSPVPSVAAELQAQWDALARASVQVSSPRSGVLSAEWSWSRPAGQTVGYGGWYADLSGSGPLDLLDGRWVTARVRARASRGGGPDYWFTSLAAALGRTHVRAELETGLRRRDVLTLRSYTHVGRVLDGRLDDLAWSVAAGASASGGELLELGGSVRPTPRTNVTASVRIQNGSRPFFSLGFTTRTPGGYVNSRAAHGERTDVFLSADGGVAWDGGGSPMLLPFHGLGRGGVSGRVFYDVDGDGAWGPGEDAASGVDVLIDGARATTDGRGRFRTWELQPYDAAEVVVDSLGLDPAWAAEGSSLVRPAPNLFTEVSIPLHRTRELLGSVVWSGSAGRVAGGVTVEVVDADGTVVARERTFSDGVFYVQRLRRGRYTVRVAPSSLAALGAESVSGARSVEIGGPGTEPVELPPLELESAR